jgi:hypothetical protein
MHIAAKPLLVLFPGLSLANGSPSGTSASGKKRSRIPSGVVASPRLSGRIFVSPMVWHPGVTGNNFASLIRNGLLGQGKPLLEAPAEKRTPSFLRPFSAGNAGHPRADVKASRPFEPLNRLRKYFSPNVCACSHDIKSAVRMTILGSWNGQYDWIRLIAGVGLDPRFFFLGWLFVQYITVDVFGSLMQRVIG